MSDPYRTNQPKPMPKLSWTELFHKYLEIARPIILMCGGALAVLGIIPFNIVIFFACVELVLRIQVNIATEGNCNKTDSRAWAAGLFVGVLLAFYVHQITREEFCSQNYEHYNCKEKTK